MKIFYSWQSDTPNKIGRGFIRKAIDQAVKEISDDPELTEADRPEVTSDTQGVLGSPAIAETIFEKIRSARVVIVDVSLIGQTSNGKKLINSNVAIELGYTLGQLGYEPLLLVKNTHYGTQEELPFDLRHRRGGVEFNLNPNASKREIREERANLATELAIIFKKYLNTPAVPKKPYTPRQPTLNPSAYWKDGEVLVQTLGSSDCAGKELEFGNQPRMFLHIWPDQVVPPISIATINTDNNFHVASLNDGSHGLNKARNTHGLIFFDLSPNSGELWSTTQIFKNGEIWGVNCEMLSHDLNVGEQLTHFIPSQSFEDALSSKLDWYLNVARDHFNYPDNAHVRAGLTNISGYVMAMGGFCREKFSGAIHIDNVVVECEIQLSDQTSIDAALLKIFEDTYEATGTPRPQNLYGFPPAPNEVNST